MSEELGIIRKPGYGMRDANDPILWFEVNTLGGTSLQVMRQPEADAFIRAAGVYDVRHLEGRPVVIERSGMTMRVVRMADC
jgi:hypothetical protein